MPNKRQVNESPPKIRRGEGGGERMGAAFIAFMVARGLGEVSFSSLN